MRRLLILLLATGTLLLADEPLSNAASRRAAETPPAGNALAPADLRAAAGARPAPAGRYRDLWLASLTAMIAANVVDSHSSWGYPERNGLLRGSDGTFGSRAVAIKSGMIGGIAALEWLLTRGRGRGRGMVAIMNFGASAAITTVAIRNYQRQDMPRPQRVAVGSR